VPAEIARRTGETLVELLDLAVAGGPGAGAFVMPRGIRLERWNYAELGLRSRRLATALSGFGVGSGTRVATWAANDPWLVAAYFAIWRLGAVVVPLDLRMASEVAVRIGRAAEPVLTLVGPDVPIADASALGAPVLTLDDVRDMADATEPSGPTLAPSSDTIAEILFTSGTTSDPKGVILTHGQLVHSARTIAITAGLRRERALALIPLSHMYGQLVPVFYGLVAGCQLTFLPVLTPSTLVAAMRRDRITVITAVPQLLRLLMDGIEAEAERRGRLDQLRRLQRVALRLPLRARRLLFRAVLARFGGELRTITCGGALLPAELQRSWEALGVVVIQGYGSTECPSITGHTRRSRRIGTVGPPLAAMTLRLAPDGEILVRGPNVMAGYWRKPDDTAVALDGGWAHSGDAAEIDAHGELVIRGRTRDRITLPSGLKVYPDDVESAIAEETAIRGAVVLESSSGRLAAVLLPATSEVGDDELDRAIGHANDRLAAHQRVGTWLRYDGDDFPRTHTLKVRRRDVEVWFRAGETGQAGVPAQPPAASTLALAPARVDPTSAGLVTPALLRLVADVRRAAGAPAVALNPATSLDALGFDSLGRVGLALQVEDIFGVSLDDTEIAGATNLAALAAIIVGRRGETRPSEPSRWAYGRLARLVRRLLDRFVTGPVVALVARPAASGLEHLHAGSGPVLICANHSSHLDAPTLRYVMPAGVRNRTAIAAAADYFFEGSPIGPLVALATAAFPFGRTDHVRESLERVASYVDDGWNIILFPEGTRSTSGQMGPFKSGIGLLATQLEIPVVPAAIVGAYEILPKGRRFPRRHGRVRVAFGPPLIFERGCGPQEATARIEVAVRRLADARAR
jgi:long-chain acyl-CoA synthetase